VHDEWATYTYLKGNFNCADQNTSIAEFNANIKKLDQLLKKYGGEIIGWKSVELNLNFKNSKCIYKNNTSFTFIRKMLDELILEKSLNFLLWQKYDRDKLTGKFHNTFKLADSCFYQNKKAFEAFKAQAKTRGLPVNSMTTTVNLSGSKLMDVKFYDKTIELGEKNIHNMDLTTGTYLISHTMRFELVFSQVGISRFDLLKGGSLKQLDVCSFVSDLVQLLTVFQDIGIGLMSIEDPDYFDGSSNKKEALGLIKLIKRIRSKN